MKISISAFRAIDNPSCCEEFMEGHANVLRDIGISVNKLTSANAAWTRSPESNVIVARSLEDGKLVGGVRVDLGGGSLTLPIEEAVGELDKRIFDVIKKESAQGTGELCGLWTARRVAGMGIAVLLLRSGIAISSQLKIKSMLVLCSEATLSMLQKMGCRINTSLGNNGTFYYPKEDLLATALIIPDIMTLDSAEEFDREFIFDLRKNLQLHKTVKGPKGDIETDFNLALFQGSAK